MNAAEAQVLLRSGDQQEGACLLGLLLPSQWANQGVGVTCILVQQLLAEGVPIVALHALLQRHDTRDALLLDSKPQAAFLYLQEAGNLRAA
jgi:hypothetical protein